MSHEHDCEVRELAQELSDERIAHQTTQLRLERMQARVASRLVMEALDMPDALKDVQDSYWSAEREWQELDRAYRIVVSDMLKRKGDLGE